MNIESQLLQGIAEVFEQVFGQKAENLSLQLTRKEFEGNYTFVTFPYGKITGKKPDESAKLIGDFLQEKLPIVEKYNIVKGFLNISISDSAWLQVFQTIFQNENFGYGSANGKKVMVEYSSPNTNKPLHLGHLRNNFLGFSVSQILKAAGYEVMMTNLVNDRGIHICKSMLAYQKFGKGETPESEGFKGDKLVGDYYVKFDKFYKQQIKELVAQYTAENPSENPEKIQERAEKNAPAILEAQEMLKRWEENEQETVDLWKKMNAWVYAGFEETYRSIGIRFDKIYYESNTYLLGKEVVTEGLAKNVFFQKPDGSVWIDLTEDGLDQKLLLRGDGTSVYITQDLGTADLKYRDFPMQKSVYVVGNEQDYHFKVLQLIMQKLGRPYADGIYHLSYGMVELPSGKMKSREGTVVDADDLVAGMVEIAAQRTAELGKIADFTKEEATKLYQMLALGALKYYLLRVDPKKKMMFNPEESIDFQGDTGVYIQYTHAKISAILRRADSLNMAYNLASFAGLTKLEKIEMELIQLIHLFPRKVQESAENYSPAEIAGYAYELAKLYGRFYAELSIFNEENTAIRSFRIALSTQTARVLKNAMQFLGVEVPSRM